LIRLGVDGRGHAESSLGAWSGGIVVGDTAVELASSSAEADDVAVDLPRSVEVAALKAEPRIEADHVARGYLVGCVGFDGATFIDGSSRDGQDARACRRQAELGANAEACGGGAVGDAVLVGEEEGRRGDGVGARDVVARGRRGGGGETGVRGTLVVGALGDEVAGWGLRAVGFPVMAQRLYT